MSNPLCERLLGKVAFVAFLIACVLPFPASLLAQTSPALPDPAAEFVQLTADIETLAWGRGSRGENGPRPESYQIHAIVGRNKWILENQFGQTHHYSFDGTNIVERAWIRRTLSAQGPNGTNSSGYWLTRSSESQDGNPCQTVRVSDHLDMVARIAWLAFCSAPTLNNRSHKLYPLWDLWKEYIDPPTFVERINRFQDDLGLPKTVLLSSGEHQPVLDYRVSVTTNAAGWLFPLSFFLIEYYPAGDAGWMLGRIAHGKVTSIGPAADPLPPSGAVEPPHAQAIRFVPVPPSRIHIEGTSDVYDWSLDTTHVVGFVELNHPLPAPSTRQTQPLQLDTLLARAEFLLPVRHFNSPYSTPMFSDQPDQAVLHRVLHTTDHPNIIYRLHLLTLTNAPNPEAFASLLQATGELVIGGVTNPISMPVQITRQGDVLRLSGSTSLRLSDFRIKPPSVESNDWAIEVGDIVRPSFDLQFKKVEAR